MSSSSRPVVVVTGSNTGVGKEIARRIASGGVERWSVSPDVVLACRTRAKADAAREDILASAPDAHVHVMIVDTSSMASVKAFCSEFLAAFTRLDLLYCNAGILPTKGLRHLWMTWLFLTRPKYALETAEHLYQVDWKTKDGLNAILQTNVLGHFLMVELLTDCMHKTKTEDKGTPCVVWTSSRSARPDNLDDTDLEATNSLNPYASSKRCMDILSYELNKRLTKRGICSVVTCPGNVLSQMSESQSPFVSLMWPLLYPLRALGCTAMSWTPANAVTPHLWIANTDQEKLSSKVRYESWIDGAAKPWAEAVSLEFDDKQTAFIYEKMSHLIDAFR